MMINEEKMNLFNVDLSKYVLAHAISNDVTKYKQMGAGIAKIFRNKYSQMAEYIEKHKKLGTAVRYLSPEQHVIYNLITKEFVYQKATGEYEIEYYNNLENALTDMKR